MRLSATRGHARRELRAKDHASPSCDWRPPVGPNWPHSLPPSQSQSPSPSQAKADGPPRGWRVITLIADQSAGLDSSLARAPLAKDRGRASWRILDELRWPVDLIAASPPRVGSVAAPLSSPLSPGGREDAAGRLCGPGGRFNGAVCLVQGKLLSPELDAAAAAASSRANVSDRESRIGGGGGRRTSAQLVADETTTSRRVEWRDKLALSLRLNNGQARDEICHRELSR